MEDVDTVMELDTLAVLQEQVNAEPVRYQVNAAGAEAQVVDHPWRVPTQGYSFGWD